MKRIPTYLVNAFVDGPDSGNPAAVCLLDESLSESAMTAIAAQIGYAETAFLGPDSMQLRWFTPTVEIDLCGHATLATAHILFSEGLTQAESLTFETRSGPLTVSRTSGARDPAALAMDFPARAFTPEPDERAAVAAGLGLAPGALVNVVRSGPTLIAELAKGENVQALEPDFGAIAQLPVNGVVATAPGTGFDCDFVSRFFAPRIGIPEDPVTGSAHCGLTPYWAQALSRNTLEARQLSARGGRLSCRLLGDRVQLQGLAETFLDGAIRI